ncbi:MAG: hypothetical protein MRY64_04620 [Hyphomonadaceae bacterium]|nr:hypothetical protein [Hyphomonadaceae bacterium]
MLNLLRYILTLLWTAFLAFVWGALAVIYYAAARYAEGMNLSEFDVQLLFSPIIGFSALMCVVCLFALAYVPLLSVPAVSFLAVAAWMTVSPESFEDLNLTSDVHWKVAALYFGAFLITFLFVVWDWRATTSWKKKRREKKASKVLSEEFQ